MELALVHGSRFEERHPVRRWHVEEGRAAATRQEGRRRQGLRQVRGTHTHPSPPRTHPEGGGKRRGGEEMMSNSG